MSSVQFKNGIRRRGNSASDIAFVNSEPGSPAGKSPPDDSVAERTLSKSLERIPGLALFASGLAFAAAERNIVVPDHDSIGQCNGDLKHSGDSAAAIAEIKRVEEENEEDDLANNNDESDEEFESPPSSDSDSLTCKTPLARMSAVVVRRRSRSEDLKTKSVLVRSASQPHSVVNSETLRSLRDLKEIVEGNAKIGVSGVLDESGNLSVTKLSTHSADATTPRRHTTSGSIGIRTRRVQAGTDESFYTMIYFSRQCYGMPQLSVFQIHNSLISTYMRTSLARAHASTMEENPFRLCTCSDNDCECILPDTTAKFAAVYALDELINDTGAHRKLVNNLRVNEPTLTKGGWAKYEVPRETTAMGAKKVSHIYVIYGFI